MKIYKKGSSGGCCKPIASLILALGAAAAVAAPVPPAPASAEQTGGLALPRPLDTRSTVRAFLLAQKAPDAGKPASRDSLFDDDEEEPKVASKADRTVSAASNWKGYLQFEMARTTASPVHWSKMLTRAELSTQGALGEGVKYKLGARMDYDAVYSLYNDYPAEVERNQRFDLVLRENYLDVGAGDWDFRLGKQNVVWGEMVGLFFADVVSARDMREFILPEFDTMRIPQWATRAEYFKDDFHAELLWIPIASYDEIGKPGAEFYPPQVQLPGVGIAYRNEQRPSHTLSHTNYGLRLSTLKYGWDASAFAYSSMDVMPTFYRDAVSSPGTLIYEAKHDRINQFGGTLAKDFGDVVLKGETVYTRGRQFTVLRLADADGVVPQNTLDTAIGLDFTLPADTRFNAQVFQRTYFSHDADLFADKHENGYSLLLNHKFTEKLEAQALMISSFNRTDWLLRPRVTWSFERNWRLAVGADIFKGPPIGLFGRYDRNDRVYSEVRYSF